MSFLTAAGAVAVGFVSTVVLLSVALIGWIWANEKLKRRDLEPMLPLALLIVAGSLSWVMNATTGDPGVFGVILGVVGWGSYLYHSVKEKRQKTKWEQLREWFKAK
jgi:hypothetical protein